MFLFVRFSNKLVCYIFWGNKETQHEACGNPTSATTNDFKFCPEMFLNAHLMTSLLSQYSIPVIFKEKKKTLKKKDSLSSPFSVH